MLMNRGDIKSEMITGWSEIGLPEGDGVVRGLLTREDLGLFTNLFNATVDLLTSYLLKITPK